METDSQSFPSLLLHGQAIHLSSLQSLMSLRVASEGEERGPRSAFSDGRALRKEGRTVTVVTKKSVMNSQNTGFWLVRAAESW